MNWRTVPVLRVAAALAGGICAAHFYPESPTHVGTALATLALIVVLVPVGLFWRGRIKGTAALVLFASLGFVHTRWSGPRDAFAVLPEGHYFVAELLEAPTGKNDWLGADARIVEVHGDSGARATDVRARLMIHREAVATVLADSLGALGRGSVIIADAYLEPPRAPRNPHTFDYAAFLAARGITLQAWLRADDFTSVKPAAPLTNLERLRGWISRHIDRGFGSPREAGVAKALLIGDKSDIDESTRLAYTSTGAVHVLAVSGLHTGVIAFIVVWLLRRSFRKRLPVVQFGCLLLALWAYAALTGYSPSVIRSAVMFAVVFAGQMFRQDPNGLNNLGIAALFTLVYEPLLLFTLGFQLSYLAVAGIMVFYPHLRRVLATESAWVNKGTELVAVSIAATIGTLPVTIYYFHQFPVYFALSGIVAVPLVAYALPTLLATVALDGLLTLCGVGLTWIYWPAFALVWLCNEALTLMSVLPYALVEGLWPSGWTVVLMLLTIALLGITITRRRRVPAYATMALLCLTTLVAAADVLAKRQINEVVVYSLREGTAVDYFADGRLSSVVGDGTTDQELAREIRPHRSASGVDERLATRATPLYRDSSLSFYQLGDVRWAEVHTRSPDLVASDLQLDWVYVEDPSRIDPDELTDAFPQTPILLGGRIPPWRREAWLLYEDQTYHLSDGAFYPLLAR